MTHLCIFPVFWIPAGRLPSYQSADTTRAVDDDVLGTKVGVCEFQLVGFDWLMDGVDFLFGEMIWRVTAAFKFLKCLDGEEWADPLVSKAGIERSTKSGISHDAGFWSLHCSQLFNVAAEIGDDFVLLMCWHGRPDHVEWLARESLIFDHLPFRSVEDIDHLPCRDRGLAIDQLERLVFGAPTRCLDDPVVAQAQDCVTCFQVGFAFAKIHEPAQGERNRIVLVARFAGLASKAQHHVGCWLVFARLADEMV